MNDRNIGEEKGILVILGCNEGGGDLNTENNRSRRVVGGRKVFGNRILVGFGKRVCSMTFLFSNL